MTSTITVTWTLFLSAILFIRLEAKLPSTLGDSTKLKHDTRSMEQGMGKTREKRMAPFMLGGASAILGNRARKVILSSAKQVDSGTSSQRMFVKRGSYEDALRDFYAVRPTNVQEWKKMDPKNVWGVVKSGQIGDKTIIVKSRGWDSKPVLEIIDYNAGGILVDSVHYVSVN